MGWLTGWAYRKKVTLIEQSSGAYNDFPTIITATYDAHMKSDFADCRFTESDGTTLITYGIKEKTDDVECQFVIKRNYTSGASLTVYLYYGNAGAADASVDYTSWCQDWYINNGFGKNPSAHQGSVSCVIYNHSESDTIPAWAEHVFGGCTANGGYRAFYGHVKINGTGAKWASTVVCFGRGDAYPLRWAKYNCTEDMYDHASFVKGASNTVTWGHYSGSNTGFWVSWYPLEPSVSFGAEETPIDEVDLAARFKVAQDSADLLARFEVGQSSAELLGEFVVRQSSAELLGRFEAQATAELLGKAEVQQSGSAELLGNAIIRDIGSAGLLGRFEAQATADLLGEFVVKQWQEDLPGGFAVRHSGPVPWIVGWTLRKSHTITGSVAGAQTNYPVGIKVYYGSGTDGTETIGGATFGKVYCDSKCRVDFGDIRFTKSDETSLLDYWIEEQVDSDYAIIWVEVDSIPASPGTTEIYIYYGNAGASTTSNGDNTFLIFNDCTTTTGWSVQLIVGSPLWGTAIIDGVDTIYIEANAHNEKLRIQYDTILSTGRENRRALTRVKHTSWNADGYFNWYTPLALTPITQYDALRYSSYFNYYTIYASVGGVSDTTNYNVAHPSGWYRYEKKTNAAGAVTGYRDDTELGTSTVDGDYSGGKVTYYVNEWNPGLTKHYIDWFTVGKYVDPEPTHTTWGPETAVTAAGGVLPAQFFVNQWQEDLHAEFEVGQDSAELLGRFEAQATAELLGNAVIRRVGPPVELLSRAVIRQPGSAELLGRFDVGQDSAELPALFLIPRAYDFSSGMGISFDWWGSGGVDQNIDFEMWSLTGGWVGRFPDGAAEWRQIQLSWDDLTPVDLDGTRPDSSQIIGIYWTYHTPGVRRIDGIRVWMRQDLLCKVVIKNANVSDLLGRFEIQASQDLLCKFGTQATQGFNDLKAGFYVEMVILPGGLWDYQYVWQNLAAELEVGVQQGQIEVDPATGAITARQRHAINDRSIITMCGGYRAYSKGTFIFDAEASIYSGANPVYTPAFGLVENKYDWWTGGSVHAAMLYSDGVGNWYFYTEDDGDTESTGIAGIDFTAQHTFKIIWEDASEYPATGRVRLYIDDVLKATHIIAVPTHPLLFFLLMDSYIVAYSTDNVWTKLHSFTVTGDT